jgi:thioredoxin-like negative regulator of GroEL
MKPVVDGLQQEYKGKVDIVRINTDKASGNEQQLANQFGVTVIPTFVFLNADGTVAKKVIGETKVDQMRAQLNSLK